MLKKKNIAMVMAAATVATSVAPVFALKLDVADNKVDEATLKSEVEKMLATKYSNPKETGGDGTIATDADEYKNSVYKIKAGAKDIKNMNDLEIEILTAKNDNSELRLTVIDKGHKTENGRIVAVESNKNLVYDSSAVQDEKAELPADGAIKLHSIIGTVSTNATDGTRIITLANGDKIEVGLGDYALDLNKPVDANGNIIDEDTTDFSIAKKVVGFKLQQGNKVFEKDIPSLTKADLVFNSATKEEKKFDLSDLVVDVDPLAVSGIYTQEGKDLVEMLCKANAATNPANEIKVVKNGKEYTVKFVQVDDLKPIKDSKDGGYEFDIEYRIAEKGKQLPSLTNVKITVKSNAQKDLKDFREALKVSNSSLDLKTTKYDVIAGSDRFETAVEISKEGYRNNNDTTTANKLNADAVVLVGENAVVDGLASASLSAEKNAPILLTKKDVVPTSTMNEIKRVIPKGKTVYLVGGENTISKDVEAQLIKEVNANIVRLAGDDRYDTSLKIAKELKTTVKNVYIVGGEGLADAMSIAAVAAQKNAPAPIIVSPEAGLTQGAKDFLYANRNNVDFDVDVVGGISKVSQKVIKDVESNTKLVTVDRVSGTDRNDTNARVLNKYFADATGLDNIYVAKDGDTQLVDALAAAPLVGRTTNGAIVLATNNLSDSQENVLKVKSSTVASNKAVQIGNGIASTVMQKVLKSLGL